MIDRSVLVHYRTEEAKAYRREHGDRGGCKYQDKLHRTPYKLRGLVLDHRLIKAMKMLRRRSGG